MASCFFISDLHGKKERYEKLFYKILSEKPDIIFFGGDLLPNPFSSEWKGKDFLEDFLIIELLKIKNPKANTNH